MTHTAEIETTVETKPAFILPTYKTLREGDIISIRIQDNGTLFKPDQSKGRSFGYFHFARPIAGGMLNCHLHCDSPSLYKGKTIRVRVSIIEKSLADGRKFDILDLVPVDQKTPITARLVVSEVDHSKVTVWKRQLSHAPRSWLHILPSDGKMMH